MKEKSLNVFESTQKENFKILNIGELHQVKGGKKTGRGIGDDIIWDIVY